MTHQLSFRRLDGVLQLLVLTNSKNPTTKASERTAKSVTPSITSWQDKKLIWGGQVSFVRTLELHLCFAVFSGS